MGATPGAPCTRSETSSSSDPNVPAKYPPIDEIVMPFAAGALSSFAASRPPMSHSACHDRARTDRFLPLSILSQGMQPWRVGDRIILGKHSYSDRKSFF
jgi:hypothetical protein